MLDSGPVGLLCNPRGTPAARDARHWADATLDSHRLIVPEIADYEVRRELLRRGLGPAIERLDALGRALGFHRLNTAILRDAAELWGEARNSGHLTAHDAALDGDVILAAQARALRTPDQQVVVATTNPKHLSHYVEARAWADI